MNENDLAQKEFCRRLKTSALIMLLEMPPDVKIDDFLEEWKREHPLKSMFRKRIRWRVISEKVL